MKQLLTASCWSEWESLECVALCRPGLLWVESQAEADFVAFLKPMEPTRALHEYEALVETLTSEGIRVIDLVEHLPAAARDLSDQLVNRIYTRDAAVILGEQIVPGVASNSMRGADFWLVHQALTAVLGSPVREQSPLAAPSLECGDVLILGPDAVLINAGHRTSLPGATSLCQVAWEQGFAECGIIGLPSELRWAHLDLACNVVGRDLFLALPFLRHIPVLCCNAESDQTYYRTLESFVQHHGRTVIYIPPELETYGVTNLVNHGKDTVLASSRIASILAELLPRGKYRIVPLKINELEHGGGSIRCLTLPLQRAQEHR